MELSSNHYLSRRNFDDIHLLILNSKYDKKYHQKLKEYLEKNEDKINRQNYIGWTPLHFACSNRGDYSEETLMILLNDPNINVNLQNTDGKTALHELVCSPKNINLIKILLD